jgi:hypothetical protein
MVKWRNYLLEILFLPIIAVVLAIFLMDKTVDFSSFHLAASPRLLDVKTLFLSILLEAIPFVLLGVFFSAFIQTFVRDEQVRRWTPKNPLIAIPFAALLGFLFPVCECAIVPIVRRLILKGMPVYVGIVFLLAGPVINPVVMAATYMAFPAQPDMVLHRSLIAALVAVSTGALVKIFLKRNPLKWGAELGIEHEARHDEANRGKLGAVFRHAVDEFFDMGKYLIFGALVSAVLQVYFSREILTAVGQTPVYSNLAMMGLGFVFSLCSEADAFIAASFANTFSKGSLVAFMVFGPMIDFKNTLMLLSVFRFPFVAKLIAVVFTLVLAFTLFLPM